MTAAVKEHTVAVELLADGIAEGVVRGRYGAFDCQARIDWINPGAGIVDLKTTDDLDSFDFAIRALGYVHQVAFYRSLVAVVGGHVLPVYIVAVEKREPFRCGVWQVAPAVLEEARRQNEEAMQELSRCRGSGDWFTRFEGLRLIDRL